MYLLKAPIFLLGAHKSGTSFLRSLLDGHPALAVLQKEGHYFQCAGCWTNYPARPPWRLRLDSHHITTTEWLKGLQREHQEGFDRFSDNPQFHGYDLETAKSLFSKMRDARSEAERMSLFLSTLLRASSEPAFDGSRRVVEKSVEHAHFAPHLHVLFPDAYFLHIVRDPYTALASFRRSRTAKRYPYLLPLASSLERSLLQVSCNQRILPRYRVIRYEDLAANVKSEMDRVAEFLDIAKDPCLYQPTTAGQSWTGNSTRVSSTIEKTTVKSSAASHDPYDLEIHFINQKLIPLMGLLGYETRNPRYSPWRRMPREGMRTYVKNRAAYLARV